ncbi:GNAT family N-acetyltransferase [Rhodospirillaceae bacterium SYSU D60014]|uniref:GNAT family N-acetyltransferase n=1 Tax=Virgifigura deserti TaxID=2268457 RepID=UPI000E665A63
MPAPLDIKVRAVHPDDATAILRVHEQSIRELGPTGYAPEEVESWAAGLRAEGYVEEMASGETLLVAEAESRIVGFGGLKSEEINTLYVAPEMARRGVGSALLQSLESIARDRGRRRLRLTATLIGEPFYRRHGYRELDRRKHPTRGGILIDSVVMEKDLAA